MAVRIEVTYSKQLSGPKKFDEALKYFLNVEQSIPSNFPGLQSFKPLGSDVYEWAFEKISYSGYDFQIQFQTKFIFSKTAADIVPHNSKGTELSGRWEFSEGTGGGTNLNFKAAFATELSIPSLFKSMATGLLQKEITKLFDRYSDNVAKVLSP